MMQKCCFCAYKGNTRSVKTHIAVAHQLLRAPNSFGRPRGAPCPLCGFVHDEIARPGWAIRRKRFERGKIVSAVGAVAPNVGLQTIGAFEVPRDASRIKRIEVRLSPCRGPFMGHEDLDGRRFCLTCKRPHFDARKPTPRKRRFMMIHDGRMIQCDLQPGHSGAHEVPQVWRRWWETGDLGAVFTSRAGGVEEA